MKIDSSNIRPKAACKDKDTAMFFVDEGPISNSKIRIAISKAVAICNKCDVQIECLVSAVNNNEEFGIWGGLTSKERKKMIISPITIDEAKEVVLWKRSL